MKKPTCEICRRLGVKLFLRGEKCFSPKCPMVKRAYPPGQKTKRRLGPPSEYALQLREKQKLKYWYNLRERQFKNYVREVLRKGGGNMPEELIKKLENRLDNTVFRLGFALSRRQARQLVSHGFFLVNDKKVNIPSYQLKRGDKISLRPGKEKKSIFTNLKKILKKQKVPSWLQLDVEKLEAKVIGQPNLAEAAPPGDILTVFEFYSR